MTLFLKIISDFLSFLTATGSPFLTHLQSLTSPKAPLPIILTEGKSRMVIFLRYSLRMSASSCMTLRFISSCYLNGMQSICILRLSWSQYSFFCCSWTMSLEYLCSMKLLAASTFSLVALEITISLLLSMQIFKYVSPLFKTDSTSKKYHQNIRSINPNLYSSILCKKY